MDTPTPITSVIVTEGKPAESALAPAAEGKIKKRQKVASEMDAFGLKKQIVDMNKDGWTTEQIATALGYSEQHIAVIMGEQVEVGSPEQVLHEALKTAISLIPVADTVYRIHTSVDNAMALTNFITTAQSLVKDLYSLKEKEKIYQEIIQKVMQPFVRRMIKELMLEVRAASDPLNKEEFSTNLGIKFQEAYRKAAEELATAIGISSDEKARALAGIALSSS